MKTRTVKSLKEKIKEKTIQEKANELNEEIEKQNRQDEIDCLKEVSESLKKYKCSLVESVRFVRGHNQPFFETKIIKNKG
jgi:CHASE3 domain sensor protein